MQKLIGWLRIPILGVNFKGMELEEEINFRYCDAGCSSAGRWDWKKVKNYSN
ncbi:MAG: hypothetical protein LC102_13175 [Ignavibacteriales bacterium]|nr:hypothetical protein [Ignavibacteria bacterium]MCZ2144365.1 hypothetical protein [Ignavibacteriales bacterium]WKZ72929.1 MAG: hypothetical protein QY308_01715 [Ignavibacteriaceae bacterium]